MKVKSLLDKDFEEVDLKKVDLDKRLRLTKRKMRSLAHQQSLLNHTEESLIKKLIDDGIAYTDNDEKMKRHPSHYQLIKYNRKTYYMNHSPENKPIFDFFSSLKRRWVVIYLKLADLNRSVKGIESAITRKQREDRQKSRWGVSFR